MDKAALAINMIFYLHLFSESRTLAAVSSFPVPTAIGNGYCDLTNNKEECGKTCENNVGQGCGFL